MAIVPIPEKPVLPNAPAFRDPAVQKFGQDLVRMLYSQMSLVARRANASVWIDPGDDQTAGKLLEFTGLGNKVAASSKSGVSSDNAEGLAAIMAASVGIPAKTGHNTYVARTIVGTANEIDVANGDGVSGNPTLGLSASISAAKAYRRGNVFGSMGLFGGQPTGALMDYGFVVNRGWWWKYANDLLIQSFQVVFGNQPVNTQQTVTWIFPVAFGTVTGLSVHPTVTGQFGGGGSEGDVGLANYNGIYLQGLSTTAVGVASYAYRASLATGVYIDLLAVGRW